MGRVDCPWAHWQVYSMHQIIGRFIFSAPFGWRCILRQGMHSMLDCSPFYLGLMQAASFAYPNLHIINMHEMLHILK